MTSKRGRGGRGRSSGRGRNRGARQRNPENRNVVLSRSQLLGSVPSGSGGFTATAFSGYPSEATIAPIAQSYAEYRYTSYRLRIVPACSSSTLGNVFVAFQYSPPFLPADLAQASAISGFRAGPAYGRVTTSSIDPGARSRRWLRVVQGSPTDAQLVDPDIVQVWPTIGSQGVQAGLSPADVYVDYTIQFRGPVPSTHATVPAVVSRGLAFESLGRSTFFDDEDEDQEGDQTMVNE